MSAIVITGATGYIGGFLLPYLCLHYEVWCTVRNTSDANKIINTGGKLLFVDDLDSLYGKLEEIRPECLIHLAGLFLGEHNRDNIQELLQSNIVFPTVLLDAAYCSGCRQFIHTGTCWQRYQGEAYNPVNLYAATKQALEDLLQYYVRAKKCKAITLELFDSYGPDDSRNKVLNLVSRLQDGAEIDMSPGEQKLYMIHVQDIVQAYLRAMELLGRSEEGTYKKYAVRDDVPIALKDIVNTYLKVSGKRIRCEWGKRSYRDREIMNPEGIGTILPGWHPEITLEEGLRGLCR